MKARYKLAIAVLAGVVLGAVGVKADICSTWVPDKDINEKAHQLAFLVLNGDVRYYEERDKAYDQMKRGPDPRKNMIELIVDLHCQDPEDVSLDTATGSYKIDLWRIESTRALESLRSNKDSDVAKTTVEKHLLEIFKSNLDNKDTVPESKDIFVADFNRRAERRGIPFEAHKDTRGNVKFDVVERDQTQVRDQPPLLCTGCVP
jgi:hypothetical protein